MPRNTSSRRAAGFSIVDLLVVIVCITALLAVQIPTDAAARRTARRMQNSTQLRGIHQALVTFANSNKDNFAGLTSKGEILADSDANTGSSGRGDTVQARYWILVEGDFFTPEYMISPLETALVTEYDWGQGEVSAPVIWNDRVKHYSFAMLGYEADANNPKQVSQDTQGRASEWATTLNSQAIVIADRNTGTDADGRVSSYHTGDFGDWQGSVLWNDNHVGFEMYQYFETKYANGALHADGDFGGPTDNLFSSQADPNGKVGVDALMVTADNDLIHAGE